MDAERRRPLNIAKDFVDALKPKKGTQAYDTTAQIVRIEDNTAWVHIPGGIDETPVKMTINATEGQTVQVRVADGTAFLVGNASAPPTDDRVANIATTVANTASDVAHTASNVANTAVEYASSAAQAASEAWDHAQDASDAASAAQDSADDALEAAQSAQTSATNANEYASRALGGLSTVQSVAETLTWITQHGTMTLTTDTAPDPTHVYFVRDNNGDYQVGNYRYSIVTEPQQSAMSTYYELSIDESLNNYVGTHLALTNEGLWLLPAGTGTYKVLVATGAGTTYTNAGVYIIDSTGGTVGYYGGTGLEVFHGLTEIAHLGYGSGKNSTGGTSQAPYYTIGQRVSGSTVGNYSVAEGINTTASGYASHAEGNATTASGADSHAEGQDTTASGGSAHAEGFNTTASGAISHAEGNATTASGYYSHAEGEGAEATNYGSHAEGYHTTASGYYSHAEGYETTASGYVSHAGGEGTIAAGSWQTVIGKYTVENSSGSYRFIIGGGTADNNRLDALKVDSSGNITSNALTASKALVSDANKRIVSSSVSSTELGYLSGATSSIQTQLNGKQATISGGASTITSSNLTASKALVSNASGKVAASSVSSTELGYLSGVTSAIQTQLNGKQDALSVTISASIGTAGTSCPSGTTGITQGSVTFEPGTYLILVSAFFSSNATGRRVMYFSTTSSGSAIDGTVYDARMAVDGAASRLKFQTIKTFETSTTLYLRATQNSGSSLTFTAEYSSIKIS